LAIAGLGMQQKGGKRKQGAQWHVWGARWSYTAQFEPACNRALQPNTCPSITMLEFGEQRTDFDTGLVPQITYYSRVGLELGKLLVHQRGMAPP